MQMSRSIHFKDLRGELTSSGLRVMPVLAMASQESRRYGVAPSDMDDDTERSDQSAAAGEIKLGDGLTFDVGRVVDSPAGLLVVLAVFGHVIGAGRFERLVAVAGGEISRRLGRRPADDAVGHFRVDVQ